MWPLVNLIVMRLYALVLFCLVNGSPIEEYALKVGVIYIDIWRNESKNG